MKLKLVLPFILCLLTWNGFAQQSSIPEIKTPAGIRYINNTFISYPIAGKYLFEGGEPIVVINPDGTGIYQLHDALPRPMVWGLDCSKLGEIAFIKGHDSIAYTLWYKFTDGIDADNEWKSVEYSIHFKTMKMYIQGERVKYFGKEPKK